MGTLLDLFISFTKIGFGSFGGLSMIPQIMREMISHGWMTAGEVSDIVAIAEMTPGPLGMNCATFAGIRAAGIPGAIISNIGILMPTFTIGLLAAVFFERFKNSRLLADAMVGVRPACIGMIFGVVISMLRGSYTSGGEISVGAVCIGVISLVLLMKFKLGIPAVICISAVLGILINR